MHACSKEIGDNFCLSVVFIVVQCDLAHTQSMLLFHIFIILLPASMH